MRYVLETKKESDHIQPYVEIWKSCVGLHMFHDKLRQERARRFTLIQIALAGSFAFSLRSSILASSIFEYYLLLAFALFAGIGGLVNSWIMKGLNDRTIEYLKTVKNQTQNIEGILSPLMPLLKIFPYAGQYRVLNERSLSIDAYGKYQLQEQNESENGEAVGQLGQRPSQTAHEQEQLLIRVVFFAWGAGLLALLAITAGHSPTFSPEKPVPHVASSPKQPNSVADSSPTREQINDAPTPSKVRKDTSESILSADESN